MKAGAVSLAAVSALAALAALPGCAGSGRADRTASPPAPARDLRGEPEGATVAHDFFLRARRYEMEGNALVALGYYRIAFEYDPHSRDLCFILLDRLKEAGRLDSAIALGRTCLKLKGNPSSFEYQSLGEAYLRQDKLEGALECYRRAVELDENDKDALYTLAGLYEKVQDFRRYAETAEKLLPRMDYPPRLVEKVLQAYRFLGRPQAAEPLLREAWKKTGRPGFGESLAAFYETRDQQAAFLETAEQLERDNPDHPLYTLMRARALGTLHFADSALGLYESLLRQNPDEREYLFPYAALLQDLGRFEESYPAFRKLAEAHPRHGLYQYFLGAAALELRKPEARPALEAAAGLEPEIPDYWARLAYADRILDGRERIDARLKEWKGGGEAWQPPFFRGLVHAILARHLEPRFDPRPAVLVDTAEARRQRRLAVAGFREALGHSPKNRRILFELGANLERLGERREAMALLRKLVKLDSANAVALNYLGYMLVEDDRELDYAGRLIDGALALEPENGAYLDSKGWWHYRKGDYAAARRYLERAARRLPRDPVILEHLATVLELLSETRAARDTWSLLLQVDPAHAEARRKAGSAPEPDRKR